MIIIVILSALVAVLAVVIQLCVLSKHFHLPSVPRLIYKTFKTHYASEEYFASIAVYTYIYPSYHLIKTEV